jgi:hypothetical protein
MMEHSDLGARQRATVDDARVVAISENTMSPDAGSGRTSERDAPKPIVGYKQKIGHGAGAQSRSPQQFGSSSHVSAGSTSLLASVNSLASVDSTVRGDSSDRVDARTGPGIVLRCSISDGVTPHPQARGKTSAIAHQKKRV